MTRFILTICSIVLCICLSCDIDNKINLPQPSDGTIIRSGEEEGDDHINRKEQYFENMHRAGLAP